uniref:Uncharacterized protein n=1 Tax=Ananas comosus var. bracteatus TaxID=296719 RepID=A0A6V7PH58_ANACO|nr:unnamed protein product [Ananas comosus var. bracteatus]
MDSGIPLLAATPRVVSGVCDDFAAQGLENHCRGVCATISPPDGRCWVWCDSFAARRLGQEYGELLPAEVHVRVPSPRARQCADYPRLIDSRPSTGTGTGTQVCGAAAQGEDVVLQIASYPETEIVYRGNPVRSAVCRRRRDPAKLAGGRGS